MPPFAAYAVVLSYRPVILNICSEGGIATPSSDWYGDLVGKSAKPVRRKPSELEIAIAGDGVHPDSVPIRETLAVLEAMLALVESVAREENAPMPNLSLVAIRDRSAAYGMVAKQKSDRRVLRRTLDACHKRGRGFGNDVRRNLRRLFDSTRTGHLRVRSVIDEKEIVVQLAAPIEADEKAPAFVEVVDVVYGRVTAVAIVGGEYRVTIRYEDSGSGVFTAEPHVALAAADLFDKSVVATVTFRRGITEQDGNIESITANVEKDFLESVRAVRSRLSANPSLVGSALLAELRDDDSREDG
jgi:hypothetical protein